jgi:hypothetical protein
MVAFPRNYSVRLQHISEMLVACAAGKVWGAVEMTGLPKTVWTI